MNAVLVVIIDVVIVDVVVVAVVLFVAACFFKDLAGASIRTRNITAMKNDVGGVTAAAVPLTATASPMRAQLSLHVMGMPISLSLSISLTIFTKALILRCSVLRSEPAMHLRQGRS